MREIKFRVWQKDKKVMMDVKDYDFESKEIWAENITGAWYKDDELEIMQYTGLKDKNGKEIYEGDIVRCRVNDNSVKGDEAYALDKDGFGLECVKKTVNYKIEFWNSLYNYGYRVKSGRTNFMINQGTILNMDAEVIGNIYENPELLEAE